MAKGTRAKKPKLDLLTQKQYLFAQKWAENYLAKERKDGTHKPNYVIAQECGFGGTPESSSSYAATLLANPKVQEVILSLLGFDPTNLLTNLGEIANFKITDVMSWDAHGIQMIPSDQLKPSTVRAIKSIKITHRIDIEGSETWSYEVTPYDKIRASELIFRLFGAFESADELKAINTLLKSGLASPTQAAILSDGLTRIRAELLEAEQKGAPRRALINPANVEDDQLAESEE